MILRVFRATIREGRKTEFERLVREQSIPWLNRSEGIIAYFPGKPLDDDSREFVMITLWRDQHALEKFAGANWRDPTVTADETPLVQAMSADHYALFGKEPVP